MQAFDHAAVDGDDAFAGVLRLGEGGDDLAGPVDFAFGRREDLIARADLRGVDQGLAVHAERAALLTFSAQAVFVAEVVVDAVDDVELVGAGGGHGHGKPGDDGQTVVVGESAAFLEQVVGAEDEAGQVDITHRADGGDLTDVEDRGRGLDHRPDLQTLRGTGGLQHLVGGDDVAGARYLGQEHGMGAGGGGSREIAGAPGRFQAVDAHDQFAVAVASALDRLQDLFAGLLLGVGSNAVLEIEDQAVGGNGLGLFQCPFVDPGHVKNTAAWSDLHGWSLNSLLRGQHS